MLITRGAITYETMKRTGSREATSLNKECVNVSMGTINKSINNYFLSSLRRYAEFNFSDSAQISSVVVPDLKRYCRTERYGPDPTYSMKISIRALTKREVLT